MWRARNRAEELLLAVLVATVALTCLFAVVWGTRLYFSADVHWAYLPVLTWLGALHAAVAVYTLCVAIASTVRLPGDWRLGRWAALTWGTAFLWGCGTVWFAFALFAFTVAAAFFVVPGLLVMRGVSLLVERSRGGVTGAPV